MGTRWRLSGMMALIYAVQGSWWPLLAVHLQELGIDGRGRGLIFGTLALAAIATPLGAGQLADRLMPTQRLLSLVYALGTGLLAWIATGPTVDAGTLFAIFLAYWIFTAPTYGLANSLAFRNLSRPAEQFGKVRLWGTVGWMTVGWTVTAILTLSGSTRTGGGTFEAFWVAAALSAVFAVFCLWLPNTPPLDKGTGRGLDLRGALELARHPDVAVFLLIAFGVSLTTPFVYQTVPPYLQTLGLPRVWIAMAMTLGQVLEIVALALLPAILGRFGTRRTLAIGIAAWVAYYAVLASHPPLALALATIPVNGIGIACFIVAGQLYLDAEAPAHRRAGAQSLHVMVTSGIGSLCGNILAGWVVHYEGGTPRVFLVPMFLCVGAFLALFAFFRPRTARDEEEAAPASGERNHPRLACARKLAPEAVDG